MIIMPDCDQARTVTAMMSSFFGNAGQRCLAAANCVVVGRDDRSYQTFVDSVVKAASGIRIGYGLDESVQMGPLRDPAKKERVLRYIERGLKDGARLRLDGRQPKIVETGLRPA